AMDDPPFRPRTSFDQWSRRRGKHRRVADGTPSRGAMGERPAGMVQRDQPNTKAKERPYFRGRLARPRGDPPTSHAPASPGLPLRRRPHKAGWAPSASRQYGFGCPLENAPAVRGKADQWAGTAVYGEALSQIVADFWVLVSLASLRC